MEYRSISDLNQCLVGMAWTLPRDLDLIVGVPRSGLLAANLLALNLNLPLTDTEGLISGRSLPAGTRYPGEPDGLLAQPRNVLVVDDSVSSGARLRSVRQELSEASLPHRVHYAAAYISPEARAERAVDFFGEVVPLPRVFEWNVLNTPLLGEFCVDIDGVLCHDPSHAENDDGRRYRRFLAGATPLYLPAREVGWLVTCRLEKYRADTEAWLAAHGVRYRHLIMMSYATAAERRAARGYASYKATVYQESGARLFIESSPGTATRMAELTGKPVFCMDTRELLSPGSTPRVRNLPMPEPSLLQQVSRRANRIRGRISRALLPRQAAGR